MLSVQGHREALIDAALQAFGSIDVLVNNAAQITVAAYHQLCLEQEDSDHVPIMTRPVEVATAIDAFMHEL